MKSIPSHRVGSPDGRPATKRSLSVAERRLAALFQRIRYGVILQLRVQHGEPDWGSGVRWRQTVKVTGANDPHPSEQTLDYLLRREVVEFFRLLACIGSGEILNVEIRNGLPFTFQIEGVSQD
jgi:hypothetical protein